MVRLKVRKEDLTKDEPPALPGGLGRARASARSRPGLGRLAHAIRRDTLEAVLAAATSAMPHEFAATLRAKDGVVYELVFVPGTISGETSAIMGLYHLPPDPHIVGSVHSHPSGNYNPSEADRQLFSHFGSTHIILGYPFTPGSWRGYNAAGERRKLEIID